MAWTELLTSDGGLASIGVIVFIIGMAAFLGRMFTKKMNEAPRED